MGARLFSVVQDKEQWMKTRTQEFPCKYTKEVLYWKADRAVEQAGRSSCRASISRVIQDLLGHFTV